MAERIRDVADTNTAHRLDWSHLADQDSQIPPARLREMRKRDPGEPYVIAHGASPIRSWSASSTSDFVGTLRPSMSTMVHAIRNTRS